MLGLFKLINPNPIQVVSSSREDVDTNLLGPPFNGELPEPTLIVGNDPPIMFVPLKELSSLEEEISSLQNVFPIKLNGLNVAD